MAAVLGAAPKMMTATGCPASAMVEMKTKVGTWPVAFAARQASAAPLRMAAPLAVAVTSHRAVALALREVVGQPAVAPQ